MRKYHIQDREDYHKCVSVSFISALREIVRRNEAAKGGGGGRQMAEGAQRRTGRSIARRCCRCLQSRVRLNLTCRYNKLCGSLRSLIHRLSLLPAADPYRQQKETEMLNKLYDMGILGMSFLAIVLAASGRTSEKNISCNSSSGWQELEDGDRIGSDERSFANRS